MNEIYSHIAHAAQVRIDVTAEESAAIFAAYDDGISNLSEEDKQLLDVVISNLKDLLWR